MVFLIRRATEKDYESVGLINEETSPLVMDEKQIERRDEGDSHYLLAALSDDNDKAVVFVAEWHEKVIGFIYAEIEAISDNRVVTPYVEIYWLAVKKSFRRRGVGKSLLERIAEWALERKSKKLRLYVWERNKTAVAFYKKHCFLKAGENMERTLP